MVGCAVFGCNNNNSKWLKRNQGNVKKVHYYRFPKDEAIRKVWILKCCRKDKFNVQNAKICCEHFKDEDFEIHYKHDYFKLAPKSYTKLKSNAYPTENIPTSAQSRSIAVTTGKDNSVQNSKYEIRDITPGGVQPDTVHFIPKEKSLSEKLESLKRKENSIMQNNEIRIGNIAKDVSLEEGNVSFIDKRIGIHLCESENISQLKTNVEILDQNVQIKSLQRRIIQLQKENHSLKTELASVEALFTKGQIKQLRAPHKRTFWEMDDITSALSLYAAGPEAYKLLKKRKFPLPGTSTLRKWSSKLKMET